MRVSYNWLNKYVDLKGISADELSKALTFAGLEVEEYFRLVEASNLVIGEVISCDLHPDSDHLKVCQVNIGLEFLNIVCGAKNVAAAQKVIVARIGAVLPGNFKIKKSVIRGVESSGMICSLSELGIDKKFLAEEQLVGIEVLDAEAPLGMDALKYLGYDDYIFDISLTPNRNDCLAMWSLAKEVAAILKSDIHLPSLKDVESKPTTLKLTVNTSGCDKLLGQIVNGIVIKPSPLWLRQALFSAGIKSVNNVVDISNYVMLETGQPLHFYDLDSLPEKSLEVSDNYLGSYEALDENTYQLTSGDLVIRSQGRVIGIAGIMGGNDSKITSDTKNILIEAASFNQSWIRKTAKRLNINSEASQRYQKGIDYLGCEKAIARAVELLNEFAGAQSVEEIARVEEPNYSPLLLDLELSQVNRLLGTMFTLEEVVSVFERLDFKPVVNFEKIQVTIPSYRLDITLPVDLIEEVIRLIGYDKVPSTLVNLATSKGGYNDFEEKSKRIQSLMVGYGFQEVLSYSLVDKVAISSSLFPKEAIEIFNPLSENRKYYRTSLLPSLLETVIYNNSHFQNEYSIFEIANVYDKAGNEDLHLGLVMSPVRTLNRWQGLQRKNDFYLIKGIINDLLLRLGYSEKRISYKNLSKEVNLLHPLQSATILIDKNIIGYFGSLHPLTAKLTDIAAGVVAEINLTSLFEINSASYRYSAPPRYPSTYYDISVLLKKDIEVGEVIEKIKRTGGRLIKSVEVFDVFYGKYMETGLKSVAFRLIYQDENKTLEEGEVLSLNQKIIEFLKKEYDAQLRV